jgi:hypothetical protein
MYTVYSIFDREVKVLDYYYYLSGTVLLLEIVAVISIV